LHGRSAYEDWPEVECKRHLLRLWLSPPGARPLPPVFAECIRVHSPPKHRMRSPTSRKRAPGHQSLTSAPCSTSSLSALSQQRPWSFSLVSASSCLPVPIGN